MEIETTEEQNYELLKKNSTMIGCLQSAVLLGGYIRPEQLQYHLDRLKRTYDDSIHARILKPDLPKVVEQEFVEWCQAVYGKIEVGKAATTAVYYTDYNLHNDILIEDC